ncbi:MAG: 3-dehydroquinate synthase [Candidatus Marinimicrobia bacterium]|jgi:3-dehydroquinate synthase|nr:3-dehydroquinate synthase [Candidatus Neomarinimicrobiota bacterium]
MQTISVPLQNRSYPIWIEKGLLTNLPELLKPMNQGQKWVIFSQNEIISLYGNSLCRGLKSAGFQVELVVLPDGEKAKSLNELEGIFSKLVGMGCDRSSTFLALGGGVVGDATGFIAGTFMRGVDYIQIPTTLLAMVDSSIGGKTGVNLTNGKNLVGAIWQPKAVVIDIELLKSLPEREITSAMGEVIKYGAILDRNLFEVVTEKLNDILNLSTPELLTEIIGRCAKLKADVVVEDEREGGKRRILNFGHTIGHALETHFGFDILRHGEAVAYGMLAAGKLSNEDRRLEIKDFELLQTTIKKLPLPKLPEFDAENILKIMQRDKKVKDRKINFVLLEAIGKTIIVNSIKEESIIKAMESL